MPLNFITKLFGSNPIKTIGDVADKFITTKEEKMLFEKEMYKLFQTYNAKAQTELTKRHELDTLSGSVLSRNIRPMTLIFLIGMFTLLSFTDGNVADFVVKQSYVNMIESFLTSCFSFYFIGRTAEKVVSQVLKNKKDK